MMWTIVVLLLVVVSGCEKKAQPLDLDTLFDGVEFPQGGWPAWDTRIADQVVIGKKGNSVRAAGEFSSAKPKRDSIVVNLVSLSVPEAWKAKGITMLFYDVELPDSMIDKVEMIKQGDYVSFTGICDGFFIYSASRGEIFVTVSVANGQFN